MVAGEVSGDQLGAALIDALRARIPDVECVGLAGEHMRAAGCVSLGDSAEIAVMGLVEPLRHLPRLLRLRRHLHQEFRRRRVDLFVGIDAPSFNLGLARRQRACGVPTAQYVSPQVWAWRSGRVKSIARDVNAVLCLLPFEPAAYAGWPVRAEFVGHPLADRISLVPQRDAARRALGIAPDTRLIAVLPGSRVGEVQRLGDSFARTIALMQRQDAALECAAPMASPHIDSIFRAQVHAAGARIQLLPGRADEVLAAADAGLIASGTATLQALLHRLPMVVAYRLAPLTAFLARELKLVKLQHFSLPNLLAGEPLVKEFFQEAVRPEGLAPALHELLVDAPRRALLADRFQALHLQLRQGGAARTADVLLDLLPRSQAVSAQGSGR